MTKTNEEWQEIEARERGYDKSKVSPRPWRHNTYSNQVSGEERECIYGFDAKFPTVDEECNDSHDLHHIVHCVNMHDELVDALEDVMSMMQYYTGNEAEQADLGAIERYDELLARAKLEES